MLAVLRRFAVAASALLALAGAGLALAQPSQNDQARAEKIVTGVCFVCHGMQGESSSEIFPRLAGQHWQYIAKQLDNFKSGKRKSSAMASMVEALNAEDMAALGHYFEKQTAESIGSKEPDLAAVGRYVYFYGNKYSGVPACVGCHGQQGLGTSLLPRLAGQYSYYLETQLRLFNQRERTNDNEVMHLVASKMSVLEIAAVAEYLSSLR